MKTQGQSLLFALLVLALGTGCGEKPAAAGDTALDAAEEEVAGQDVSNGDGPDGTNAGDADSLDCTVPIAGCPCAKDSPPCCMDYRKVLYCKEVNPNLAPAWVASDGCPCENDCYYPGQPPAPYCSELP